MEKREQARIALEGKGWRAELFDKVSGVGLGKVINLSPSGLMLMTPRALEVDSLYQVELRAEGPEGQLAAIGAGVVVLWRSEISHSEAFWSGLQIIDIDRPSVDKLRDIMSFLESID